VKTYSIKPHGDADFYIICNETQSAIARVFDRALAEEICASLHAGPEKNRVKQVEPHPTECESAAN